MPLTPSASASPRVQSLKGVVRRRIQPRAPVRQKLSVCPPPAGWRLDHLGGGLSAPRPSCPLLLLTRSLLRQAAYCDPGLISEVGTFKPEQKPTSSISLLIALRLISCAASFDEQVRAPLHLHASRRRKPYVDPDSKDGRRFQSSDFGPMVSLLACARRLQQDVQPLRLARPAALCQHPGARDRHPPCQCSLF